MSAINVVTVPNLADDFRQIAGPSLLNDAVTGGAGAPVAAPSPVEKVWLWIDTSKMSLTHFWDTTALAWSRFLPDSFGGRVDAAGALLGQSCNTQAGEITTSQLGTGLYRIRFTIPMSSANFPISLITERSAGRDDYNISYFNVVGNGFDVEINEQDNGGGAGVVRNSPFSFSVWRV